MADELKSPEKILVALKNKIGMALKINAPSLKLLVDSYYTAMYGKGYFKSHNDKVNAYGDFSRDTMTIKVFFKYLRVIRAKKAVITITVTTSRGKEVTISNDVSFNVTDEEEEGGKNDITDK